MYVTYLHVNRSTGHTHTHTHTDREQHHRHRHTHAHDKHNTPTPQTNTFHKHLTTLEGECIRKNTYRERSSSIFT